MVSMWRYAVAKSMWTHDFMMQGRNQRRCDVIKPFGHEKYILSYTNRCCRIHVHVSGGTCENILPPTVIFS